VSSIIPAPPWQAGPGVSSSGRNQPDASLLCDPATGMRIIFDAAFGANAYGGQSTQIGGTSVAAPEMAAMWALVLQACKQTASCAKGNGAYPYRLGNAAPYFYAIYNNAQLYPSTFFDVVFGSNALPGCSLNGTCKQEPTPSPTPYGFSAGVGYDHVTGIGVPFARHLIQAVVGV
jgi:subtilase family serine protease